jgi:hypothetical protein
MNDSRRQELPSARKEGLVIRELADELLVYDTQRDKAHCLNPTAALIFHHCDGRSSPAEIAHSLSLELNAPVDEKLVWFALEQFSKDHLLEERVNIPQLMSGMTRREMVRALGLAAVVAVPLVTSIVAPTPAQAATCLPPGSACTSSAQCCNGLCSGGTCA